MQCLSRLNIGCGAGTGRLQKRRGVRLGDGIRSGPAPPLILQPFPSASAASPGVPGPSRGRFLTVLTLLLVPTSPSFVPAGGIIPVLVVAGDVPTAGCTTHPLQSTTVTAASSCPAQGQPPDPAPLCMTSAPAHTSVKPRLLWAKPHHASSASPLTLHSLRSVGFGLPWVLGRGSAASPRVGGFSSKNVICLLSSHSFLIAV